MSEQDKPDQSKMKVLWDDSKMQMNYANVCNVSSTKEEFNLLFGANQSWAATQQNVRIALSNRIILNPHAAKRLAKLLTAAVDQYEAKVGPITLDTAALNPNIEDAEKH
ncbi:MAG: DUF3467 domain-containing protein [Oceanicoccus sp.]